MRRGVRGFLTSSSCRISGLSLDPGVSSSRSFRSFSQSHVPRNMYASRLQTVFLALAGGPSTYTNDVRGKSRCAIDGGNAAPSSCKSRRRILSSSAYSILPERSGSSLLKRESIMSVSIVHLSITTASRNSDLETLPSRSTSQERKSVIIAVPLPSIALRSWSSGDVLSVSTAPSAIPLVFDRHSDPGVRCPPSPSPSPSPPPPTPLISRRSLPLSS
mmetsp:Transcript_61387/g.162499  ORF Transcript_61387/g.162499 Transcript_61387/m.162499 type:complete len:217 (+) Transcript_61387:1149-1799(+)